MSDHPLFCFFSIETECGFECEIEGKQSNNEPLSLFTLTLF
jgi:hypothetical protein